MMLSQLFASAYGFVTGNPLLVALVCMMIYQKFKSSQPFPESGGRVKGIHSAEEWKAAKESGRPFVLDAFATWCPPCRAIAPTYGEISKSYPDVDFYKVDVDEMKAVAQECGVKCMPTFKLFKGGAEVGCVEGADRGAIEKMISGAGFKKIDPQAKSD